MLKLLLVLLSLVVSRVFSLPLEPRRNTPNFYLVSISSDQNYHLKPLRVNDYVANLNAGTLVQVYLDGEGLKVDTTDSSTGNTAVINSIQGANGCSTGGELHFAVNYSTNKCARYSTFALSSYEQNSQLGAKLVFNWVGGFYACNGGVVAYNDVPLANCSPIQLYTVPTN